MLYYNNRKRKTERASCELNRKGGGEKETEKEEMDGWMEQFMGGMWGMSMGRRGTDLVGGWRRWWMVGRLLEE